MYTRSIIEKHIDLLHRSWPLSVGLVLVAQTWICIEVKTVRFLPFCNNNNNNNVITIYYNIEVHLYKINTNMEIDKILIRNTRCHVV